MRRVRPHDRPRAIKGLGPARVERYGEAARRATIRAAENATSEPPVARRTVSPTLPPPARPDPPAAPPHRQALACVSEGNPSALGELWTCRLIERGFGIDEAAAIRELDRLAILASTSSRARGSPSASPSCSAPEAVEAWDAWLAQQSVDPGPDDTAQVWSLVLTCGAGRHDHRLDRNLAAGWPAGGSYNPFPVDSIGGSRSS
ncbi:MAG: hypothetical protein U0794_05940 [Isosphaeraceae bacterium]